MLSCTVALRCLSACGTVGRIWACKCEFRLVRYLLFVLTCCICDAQSIAIGGIGGARVTDDVLSFNTPEANVVSGVPAFRLESRFYVAGPTIEIGLPHFLSVEFDALYHRQRFFHTFYHDTFYTTSSERDNTWEFPFLLKYKLRSLAVDPFVEAGVAPRIMTGRVTGTFQTDLITLSPPSTSTSAASYSPSVGFVGGGGLQFHRGHLRIAPQVRYTRWLTMPVSGVAGGISGTFSSNFNQADVLVGISWSLRQ